MAKTKFLESLEKALKKVICGMFNDDGTPETRMELEKQVAGFVRDNAGEYTLEELVETFTSADAAMALFFEFQDAKRTFGEPENP